MAKVPFRRSKRWHATGYALAEGRRVIYQRDRRTFEALIVVEDDDGVGIGFRPNQVQSLIDALTKARGEASRFKLTREG